MAKLRSKNLNDSSILKIVEILDGWSTKLTWDLLVEAINFRTSNTYTRQALHKHERIKNAFKLRKLDLSNGDETIRTALTPELQKALERIARLEVETKRLNSENTLLLEQSVRWAYNAHMRGLDFDFLNKSLPPVNRN